MFSNMLENSESEHVDGLQLEGTVPTLETGQLNASVVTNVCHSSQLDLFLCPTFRFIVVCDVLLCRCQ